MRKKLKAVKNLNLARHATPLGINKLTSGDVKFKPLSRLKMIGAKCQLNEMAKLIGSRNTI